MTVQKRFTPQQTAEFAFRMKHSQHKVWIALESGVTKTFYADDCSATWLAMSCGHVREVVFSQAAGLAFCLAKEKFFRNQYRAVEIYRRNANNTWNDEPIIKFVKGKKKEVFDDTLPPDIAFKVFRKPTTNFVGFDIDLVPSIARQHTTAAEPEYIKQPSGKRSATETTAIGNLLRSGSAGKYGFTR